MQKRNVTRVLKVRLLNLESDAIHRYEEKRRKNYRHNAFKPFKVLMAFLSTRMEVSSRCFFVTTKQIQKRCVLKIQTPTFLQISEQYLIIELQTTLPERSTQILQQKICHKSEHVWHEWHPLCDPSPKLRGFLPSGLMRRQGDGEIISR